jgi:hypothetical protein
VQSPAEAGVLAARPCEPAFTRFCLSPARGSVSGERAAR